MHKRDKMKTLTNSMKVMFCIFIFAVTFAACNKYINLEPKGSTYDEVFWVNGSNVQKALSGAYSLLRDGFRADRSYFIFGDLAGGNFGVGGDYWNYTDISEDKSFNFNYVPYLEGSLWNWSRFYKVINQTHLIIENIPEIDDSKFESGVETKKQLEGEARFLRAYTYFYMQRVWGDVVLTKESFKDPQNIPIIPRTPEEETLAFCIADLEKSEELLENSSNKTLASKGAAQALLAHIYAWMHEYEEAEKYANKIIDGGYYALEDIEDYLDIWKGNSEESIFELNMLYADGSNEATAEFFNVFLTDPYIRNKNAGSAWSIDLPISQQLFNKEEARADSIFVNGAGSTLLMRKYNGVDYYDANNPNTYVVSNNLVLLRLADIYLLRAETRFKNDNEPGALQDLNKVRERAGLEDFSGAGSSLFNEITDERRRELIGEGHTQFDLIRMEQLQRVFSVYSNDRIAKKGYYWPLQMRTLLPQNPELTQNEWWSEN